MGLVVVVVAVVKTDTYPWPILLNSRYRYLISRQLFLIVHAGQMVSERLPE